MLTVTVLERMVKEGYTVTLDEADARALMHMALRGVTVNNAVSRWGINAGVAGTQGIFSLCTRLTSELRKAGVGIE